MTRPVHHRPRRDADATPCPSPCPSPGPAPWRPALAGLALLALSACATPPPAPPMLYLPSQPPAAAADMAGPMADQRPSAGAWRLVTPVLLPAALDRDAVMVAQSPGQWLPWQGLRWVEPLRDAVPRVLLADLSALHGGPVWTGRVAPGAGMALDLRIRIDEWEAALPKREVRLLAHWSLTPPGANTAQAQGRIHVRAPWPLASAEGLSQAQRAALRALAAQIVTQAGRSAAPPAAAGGSPAP